MFDRFNRQINYLRVSVTDRCNLRCYYCMPEHGIKLLKHEDILTYDEITEVVRIAVDMGIDKVRITGGEPLVRKDIITLIGMIGEIHGIADYGMTTNGTFLGEFAPKLKQAGLHRVNISLDTTDPERYRQITRGGDINQVFSGIDAALDAGLTPVKINCVIRHSPLEPDALSVKKYAEKKELEVRFIPKMDLDKGYFGKVIGGDGGNCKICNRLRLTASGKIQPCLFSNIEFDVRKLGARKAIEMAVDQKPECGLKNRVGNFYNIGG